MLKHNLRDCCPRSYTHCLLSAITLLRLMLLAQAQRPVITKCDQSRRNHAVADKPAVSLSNVEPMASLVGCLHDNHPAGVGVADFDRFHLCQPMTSILPRLPDRRARGS